MKKLEFTQFNKEMFEMMYEGLLVTPLQLDTKALKRAMDKVLDKIEAIGKRKAKPEELLYTLKDETAILELEDVEYDLVKKAIEMVPWRPMAVRKGNKLEDFIEEATGG